MAIYGLQGVVAGRSMIAKHIELAREILVRCDIKVAAHEFAAPCADIGEREHVSARETLLHGRIPLIGPGQKVVRIHHVKR